MPTPFVDFLHRDGFSLKHALGTMADIIPLLKERGQRHCAVANYGECSGWVQQLFACRKAGIVPILGFEAYLNDYRAKPIAGGGIEVTHLAHGDTRPLSELSDLERDLVTQDYPIALYARTLEGYHNVIAIHNDAQLEGFGDRPRTSNPFLETRGKGVVALMPFPYGEVAALLCNGEKELARKRLDYYRGIFDEVVIGLPFGMAEDYPEIADMGHALAREAGIRAIPVANSHYVRPEDSEAFRVLRRLAHLRGGLATYDTDILPDMHYPDGDEMDARFNARFNSREITPPAWNRLKANLADLCESFPDLEIDLDLKLPKFADGPAKLRAVAEAGFRAKGYDRKPNAAEYRRRLDYELENIAGAGFTDYFLVLHEFYAWYKGEGGLPAFGRGSAAGSLVLNCIGGTGIDPLKNHLLFERFLDAERFRQIVEKGGKVSGGDCPDVDSDVATNKRDMLKEHLAERYGRNSVASIGTVGTMQTKSLLKSLARLYEIDPQEINQITSVEMKDYVEDDDHPADIAALRDAYPGLAKLLDAHPQMAAVFGRLHGSIDSWGVHAGGVLITDFDLRDQLPLRLGKDGQVVTTWQEGIAARELGQMGFIKFDILGIDQLNIIEDICRLIKENRGQEIDVDKIPLDDYKALKQMDRHDSIAVFQCDTALTGKVTDHMGGIRCFEDLASLSTLMRPAALQNHFDSEFGERRAGKKECYIPECLKPYLGETYGLPIYQEHIMQIAMALSGFDKATAYKFMKLIYKGKLHTQEEKDEWRRRFVAGAAPKVASGEIPAAYPDRLFDQILAFLGYGFCKCLALDTLVETPAGPKPLSAIEIGDLVKAPGGFPGEGTAGNPCGMTKCPGRQNAGFFECPARADDPLKAPAEFVVVKDIFESRREICEFTFGGGNRLRCSYDHKVLCADGAMRPMLAVMADDWAVVQDGGYAAKVVAVEPLGNFPVRDLEVDSPCHRFYANGVAVSNSHATSYAKYSAVDLWFKAHYPLEYMCANLTVTPRSKEKKGVPILAQRVRYCRSIGIEVLPPLVELAGTEWQIHDGKLVAPLSNINGFGKDEARKIMGLRPFADLKDFASRTEITESRFDKLLFGGALDSFGDREFLFNWFRWWRKGGKKAGKPQLSLFGDAGGEDEIPIEQTFGRPELDALFAELNGFDLPEILPLKYAALIEAGKCKTIAMARARKVNKRFTLLCRIDAAERFTARSGNEFVRLSLSDGADAADTILQAGIWRAHQRALAPGRVVLLPAELGEKDGFWVGDLDRNDIKTLED